MSVSAEAQMHMWPVLPVPGGRVPMPTDLVVSAIESQALEITERRHTKLTYRQAKLGGIRRHQLEMLLRLHYTQLRNMKAFFTIEDPCPLVANFRHLRSAD
jgi:hypothetical protein